MTDSETFDGVGRAMRRLESFAYRRRTVLLVVGMMVIAVAILGASKLVVNDSRLLAFRDEHPLGRATKEFNRRFDGTSQLNIMLLSDKPGELLKPQILKLVERLEEFTELLPHVGGTRSLVGWVKRADQKLNRDDPAFFAIAFCC